MELIGKIKGNTRENKPISTKIAVVTIIGVLLLGVFIGYYFSPNAKNVLSPQELASLENKILEA